MKVFEPEGYGPHIASLLHGAAPPPLGPGSENVDVALQLRELNVSSFANGAEVHSDMAKCCLAGLWLLHGFLDESHGLSQRIETPSGSYWHGLMHRREPDFSNAKYWFRRVGTHPVFADLHRETQPLLGDAGAAARFLVEQSDWDAFRFVLPNVDWGAR